MSPGSVNCSWADAGAPGFGRSALKYPARDDAMRDLSVVMASRTAPPLRSVPDDAAVAEVFGTSAVFVAPTLTASIPTPNSLAAIWRIFVWSPCPISVPP